MALGLFASFVGAFFGWSMALLSLFLILLVLVQRGRGGGLTGALGGPGGQSAFGSKAGDMFTRITFVAAGLWIFLCAAAMWTLGNARSVSTPPTVGESPGTREAGGGAAPLGDPTQPLSPGDIDINELLNQAREQEGVEIAPGTEEGAEEVGTEEAPVEEVPAEDAPVEEVPADEASEVEAADEDAPEAEPSS